MRTCGTWMGLVLTAAACCMGIPATAAVLENPMSGTLSAASNNILGIGALAAARLTGNDIITRGPWVDASAYGNMDQAAILAALDAIGAEEATLLLAPGDWAIAQSLTIPSNVNLRFERGAILTIASGVALTIEGSLQAPLGRLFAGSGLVALSSDRIAKVYPQWWGASSNASTAANSAAFQAALDSGHQVSVPNGTYWLNELFATNGLPIDISGSGWNTVLAYTGATNFLTIGSSGSTIRNLKITGTAGAVYGIVLGPVGGSGAIQDVTIENAQVRGFGAGLYAEQLCNSTIAGCCFLNGYDGIVLRGAAENNRIDGCWLRGWYRTGVSIIGTESEHARANLVRSCIIDEPTAGSDGIAVRLDYASGGVLEQNHFEALNIAVRLGYGGTNNTVRNNIFGANVTQALWIAAANTIVMNNRYISGGIVDSGSGSMFLFDSPYDMGTGGTNDSRLAWGRLSGADGWLCQTAGKGINLLGRKIQASQFVANGVQLIGNPGLTIDPTNDVIRISADSQKYLDGVTGSESLPGRELTLYFADSNTQVRHGMSGTTNNYLRLANGASWTPGAYDVISFVCTEDGTWLEVGRSDN